MGAARQPQSVCGQQVERAVEEAPDSAARIDTLGAALVWVGEVDEGVERLQGGCTYEAEQRFAEARALAPGTPFLVEAHMRAWPRHRSLPTWAGRVSVRSSS